MTWRRVVVISALVALTAGAAWMLRPRPDLLIEVGADGRAMVTSGFGPRQPLGDTVRVGGAGARRHVRVVNNDTRDHQVALFRVPAGGRTDYTIPPGTYGGMCSAHPTARPLTILVR